MGVIYLHGIAYGKGSGGGGGGTTNYNELSNKPSINNVTLVGNIDLSNSSITDDIADDIVDNSTITTDENNNISVGVVSDDDINSLFGD